MITVNTKIPAMMVQIVTRNEQKEISTSELFSGKTVLFGLPGAFTPTCSQIQLPSFVQQEQALHEKGFSKIICMAVNDAFVMQAWKEQVAPNADIMMLADGSGTFTKALGLELDLTAKNMGVRCTRFLMVVEDGLVSKINVEDNPGVCSISGADALL